MKIATKRASGCGRRGHSRVVRQTQPAKRSPAADCADPDECWVKLSRDDSCARAVLVDLRQLREERLRFITANAVGLLNVELQGELAELRTRLSATEAELKEAVEGIATLGVEFNKRLELDRAEAMEALEEAAVRVGYDGMIADEEQPCPDCAGRGVA